MKLKLSKSFCSGFIGQYNIIKEQEANTQGWDKNEGSKTRIWNMDSVQHWSGSGSFAEYYFWACAILYIILRVVCIGRCFHFVNHFEQQSSKTKIQFVKNKQVHFFLRASCLSGTINRCLVFLISRLWWFSPANSAGVSKLARKTRPLQESGSRL